MSDLRKTLAWTCLLLSSCVACGKKTDATPEESGPISPPEIVAELRGAKKDYVGAWVQSDRDGAPAYLDIGPRGGIRYRFKESHPPYRDETIEGLIASFKGNDIEVTGPSPGTITVTSPPRRDGKNWQMVAMKMTFGR